MFEYDCKPETVEVKEKVCSKCGCADYHWYFTCDECDRVVCWSHACHAAHDCVRLKRHDEYEIPGLIPGNTNKRASTKKIVINQGVGFHLSHEAIMRYAELAEIELSAYKYNYGTDSCIKVNHVVCDTAIGFDYFKCSDDIISYITDREKIDTLYFSIYCLKRDDPFLVKVVEELGEKANTIMSELKIVEIPNDVEWWIDEDEMGPETIREKARSWR